MNEKSDNLQCDQIFFRKNSSSLSSKMYPSERPHCLGLEETKAKTRPVANSSSKQLRPWPPFQTVSLKVFGQFSIFSSKQLRSSFSQKFKHTHDFFREIAAFISRLSSFNKTSFLFILEIAGNSSSFKKQNCVSWHQNACIQDYIFDFSQKT